MIEVVIFACLIGVTAGAVHLYHNYVTLPARKEQADKLEMIRQQLSALRIENNSLRKDMNKRLAEIKDFALSMISTEKESDPLFGNLANADDLDEDDSRLFESDDIEDIQNNARKRFTAPQVANLRAQLPSTALGPRPPVRHI